jgi:hypothetical protein
MPDQDRFDGIRVIGDVHGNAEISRGFLPVDLPPPAGETSAISATH